MRLAGKELRRYLYLLGEGLILVETAKEAGTDFSDCLCMIAATQDSALLTPFRERLEKTSGEGFGMKSFEEGEGRVILLYGENDHAVLYAVYSFLEECGIRFYLHTDVLPEKRPSDSVFRKRIDRLENPLFSVRGILPFHDFPEGPDWWSKDNYRQILNQLVKMKGNFIGLHTYPENEKEPEKMTAEPLVWIGMPQDVNPDGSVRAAYPAQHFKTSGGSWGYFPAETESYPFGLGRLFGGNAAFAEYMEGYEKDAYQDILRQSKEEDPEKVSERYLPLFNRSGDFFQKVFEYSRKLKIKNCIGTETFLTVPQTMRRRYGLDEELDAEEITKLYQGMFERIRRKYEIDYYWLWTPEDWTWKGNTRQETEKTIQDIGCALRAKERAGADFTLALCGWTLGPGEDRTLFDRNFPKEMPFSCINRFVGFEPVEPQFEMLKDRPAWAIPWLEDDPALISAQLWAGRVRRDAWDAKRYGCDGLIGIHWRTETISPVIRGLMEAAWCQDPWAEGIHLSDGLQKGQTQASAAGIEDFRQKEIKDRYAPCGDLYEDWAENQFGSRAGARIAQIFAALDGRLPRPSGWEDGPGNLIKNQEDWEKVKEQYAFVDDLKALQMEIEDEDCRERFEAWLARFSYMRASAKAGCLKSAFDRAAAGEDREKLLSMGRELVDVLREMAEFLADSIQSMGDLGTVANIAQRTILVMQRDCDEKLRARGLLPCSWRQECSPRQRLVLLTERSCLQEGESWKVRLLVIGGTDTDVVLKWHELGEKEEHSLKLSPVREGNWLYEAVLDTKKVRGDFAYRIEAAGEKERKLTYPATGQYPEKTVVLL